MEIYLGDELGNLCEHDCKMVKSVMEGSTYCNFKVTWANYAGNCQLIVKNKHYDSTANECKKMFLHAYFSKSAEVIKWHKILEQFCKIKQVHPDGIVAFEDKYDFSFYFQDADYLSQQENPSMIVGKTSLGYSFASIQKGKFNELMEIIRANNKKVYKAEIEVL